MEGILNREKIPVFPETDQDSPENSRGSVEEVSEEAEKMESPSFVSRLRAWGRQAYEKALDSQIGRSLTKERESAIVSKGGKALYDTLSGATGTKGMIDWGLYLAQAGLKKIGINTSIKGDVHKYFAENSTEKALLGIINQAIELKQKAAGKKENKAKESGAEDADELDRLAKDYKRAVASYKKKVDNLNISQEEKLKLRRELTRIMGEHKRAEVNIEKGQSQKFNDLMRKYTGAKVDGFKIGRDALNSALSLSGSWVFRGGSYLVFSALSRGKKEWDDYSRRAYDSKKTRGEEVDWNSNYWEFSPEKRGQILKGVIVDSSRETFNELVYGSSRKETAAEKQDRLRRKKAGKQKKAEEIEKYKAVLDQEIKGVFGKKWRVAWQSLKKADLETVKRNLTRLQALGKVSRLLTVSFVGANALGEDGVLDNLGDKLVKSLEEKGLAGTAGNNLFESVERAGRIFSISEWEKTLDNLKEIGGDIRGLPEVGKAEAGVRGGDDDAENLYESQTLKYVREKAGGNASPDIPDDGGTAPGAIHESDAEGLKAAEKAISKESGEYKDSWRRQKSEELLNAEKYYKEQVRTPEEISEAIVRKGDGIESAFIRQLRAEPEKFGFTGDLGNAEAVKQWAGKEAHRIALKTGYVSKDGEEVWLKRKAIGEAAYVLKPADGHIDVVEMRKLNDGNFHAEESHLASRSEQFFEPKTRDGLESHEYVPDLDQIKDSIAEKTNEIDYIIGKDDSGNFTTEKGAAVNMPLNSFKKTEFLLRDIGLDFQSQGEYEHYMELPAEQVLNGDFGKGYNNYNERTGLNVTDWKERKLQDSLLELSEDIKKYDIDSKGKKFGQVISEYLGKKAIEKKEIPIYEPAPQGAKRWPETRSFGLSKEPLAENIEDSINDIFDKDAARADKIEQLAKGFDNTADREKYIEAFIKALKERGEDDEEVFESARKSFKDLTGGNKTERRQAKETLSDILTFNSGDSTVKEIFPDKNLPKITPMN